MAIVLVGGAMIIAQLILPSIPFLNEKTDRWLYVITEHRLYYNSLWRANAANSP